MRKAEISHDRHRHPRPKPQQVPPDLRYPARPVHAASQDTDATSGRATPRQYFREFWGLNDVLVEIKKSETGSVPQPMAANTPYWTGLGRGFILFLPFKLTR